MIKDFDLPKDLYENARSSEYKLNPNMSSTDSIKIPKEQRALPDLTRAKAKYSSS